MAIMATLHNVVDEAKFNRVAQLPYELRLHDFQMAVQDVYDLFYDVNAHLAKKGLQRLDDMLRPAIMSGVLSDMLTAIISSCSISATRRRARAVPSATTASPRPIPPPVFRPTKRRSLSRRR